MRGRFRDIVRQVQSDRSKSGRQGRETRNISDRLPSGGETKVGSGISNTGPSAKVKPARARAILQSASNVTRNLDNVGSVKTERLLLEAKERDRKIQELETQIHKLKTGTNIQSLLEDLRNLQSRIESVEKNTPKNIPPDLSTDVKYLHEKMKGLQMNKEIIIPPDMSEDIRLLHDRIQVLESKKVQFPPDNTKEIQSLKTKITELEKRPIASNPPTVIVPPDRIKEIEELREKITELEKRKVPDFTEDIITIRKKVESINEEVNGTDEKIDTAIKHVRVGIRNEQAEQERELKKEIQEIVNKRSQSVPKITRRTSSRSSTPTPIPRRTSDNDRMDKYRLIELPMFSAELFENKVIVGGAPNLLLDGDEWKITCDNKNGFEEGRYICPNAGAYDVRLTCKTLSTSVTARITLYHMNENGTILKAYGMDQSNVVNEHCAIVRIAHAEQGDSFTLWIENRFNIALKGVEEVKDDDGSSYELISNMFQIVYNPARGYCET